MFTFHDNSYTSSTGRGSITRSDSFNRVPGSPGIAASYPDISSMVAWSETPHDLRNTTDAAYRDASQDDRLWMLSQVLRNLLHMGQLDWAAHHKPAPHTTRSFRYTAALGEELLARIEASEDRVSVFWVIHADKPLTLSAE